MKTILIKIALFSAAAILLIPVTFATCNGTITLTRPDSRYQAVVGTNGAEVQDKVTKLIWQRCPMGQSWSGTACTGTATTYTWQDALDAARTAVSSPISGATAWRLPNHVELYSLAERACSNPAINTTWFPSDPASWMCSSSPLNGSADYAWIVDFYYGYSFNDYKNVNNLVRLVRTGQ